MWDVDVNLLPQRLRAEQFQPMAVVVRNVGSVPLRDVVVRLAPPRGVDLFGGSRFAAALLRPGMVHQWQTQIRAEAGTAAVTIPVTGEATDADGRRRALSCRPGGTTLEVSAAQSPADGVGSSHLDSVPSPSPAPRERGGEVYALLVGIDRYECSAVRPLQFAVADVVAFRDLLRRRMALTDERHVLLGSGSGPAATRHSVLRAIDQFVKAPCGPGDTFIFYFAGHGFALEDQSFLLTVDSDPASALLLRETAISLKVLSEYLRIIRAGQQLVILDACRNEPTALERGTGGGRLDGAMARDILSLGRDDRRRASGSGTEPTARATLSACWEGQASYEYPDGGHGWFCHHLLHCLGEPSSVEVEVTALCERIAQRMAKTAWRLLPEAEGQRPHVVLEGRPFRLRLHTALTR